ncbi:ABC transporter substrate-binding protein [Oculatella sp. LEGE 06141]|uniref:ABC transporter substrate-binding protein n=1 Tax=Oculatella sp. LEGE 06141 TaxID=1828648 RepID=UPI0018819582|nr:ABC transporter substrate-binding protein [Oculatella sp. LEGE 06141]MBE9182717.1 ABC transporter substrate-binding protein [Oculatella sp. LEGE 06141]
MNHFTCFTSHSRRLLAHKRGRLAVQSGAIALLLFVSACDNQTQTPPSPGAESPAASGGGTLKLGTLLPITGDLAQYGGPMQDAAQLAVQTINGCGGVLGQDIELISEDDQTEPAAGAAAMTKLAEVDRVAGVVGAAGSAVSSAAVDIAVRNQVVEISPASTSPDFTARAEQGEFDGFWFRTAPPDTFQGDALAQLADQQGFQNVAVLGINNDYGNGLTQSFISAFKELGGTVTNESNPTRYAPDAATFDSELSAAFSGNPDAVLLIAYPETGSLILKAAQEQGLLDGETQIIMTDGMKTDNLGELVGQTANGQFITAGMLGTAPSAGGPAIAQFRELYTNEFNREPQVYDPNTWDAIAVLALAAESAQATTGTALKDAIRDVANAPGQDVDDVCEALALVRDGQDVNYQGASGSVDFDEQGDVAGSYDVWTISDSGRLEIQETITVGGDPDSPPEATSSPQ